MRYFREHAQGYEVDPAIRSTVHFLQASVLDPKLLEGSPPYDVVFCRNLLIYLDAPARNWVLAALDRLLAADGVLFIGHADRLEVAGAPSRFTAVGESGCFAYRKRSGQREWAVGRKDNWIGPLLGSEGSRGTEWIDRGRSSPFNLHAPLLTPATHETFPTPHSPLPTTSSWSRPRSWPTGAGTPRRSPRASSTSASRVPAPRRII